MDTGSAQIVIVKKKSISWMPDGCGRIGTRSHPRGVRGGHAVCRPVSLILELAYAQGQIERRTIEDPAARVEFLCHSASLMLKLSVPLPFAYHTNGTR